MAFEKSNSLIGISFKENKLRLVEIENIGGQYQINNIIQKDAGLKFDFYSLSNNIESNAAMVGRFIEETVESAGITSRDIAFILDSQSVLVKKIPLDSDIPIEEQKKQVYWEAGQFVYNSLDDYIIDYSSLVSRGRISHDELLVVIVRKKIIDFLTRIFKQTKLNIKIVDVDVFSAIRAIKANYEYQENEKIGLIDIGPESVKITLMTHGEYFLSSGFSFVETQQEKRVVTMPDEEQLSKLISKELRRLILDHKIGKYVEDLNRIFFYGEKVQPRVVENLRNFYDLNISKVNPFRKVRFASNKVDDESIRNSSEAFVVCIGAAIRNSS